MLLYPPHIESKLGFDKIKSLIQSHCSSELGQARVDQLEVLDDYDTVNRLLDAAEEQRKQINSGEAFPELQAFELAPDLAKCGVIGYYLSAETLFRLKLNLQVARQCINFFINRESDFPVWGSEAVVIEVQHQLLKRLDQVFDRDGDIRDGASPGLKKIRGEIKAKEDQARKELETILKQATDKGYTDKDNRLTIRDGRLVVPLHAEHKRRIQGVIVDESTTGRTVYLEPIQVFNQNNDIRELRFAEKREIIAILTSITSEVAANKEMILRTEHFLAELDFTRAKAKIATKLNACKPDFNPSNSIRLINARHPALFLAHKKTGQPVVPLNMELNDEQRVIVISGPNAGGKSVCLKTVGLLQLMLQAGLLVPVDENSSMGCFTELFIDIGDEQSIESDLSTYSSHLQNMNYFLKHCTSTSLFLIDEFGAGTEPQFGGAIAESILLGLVANKARGLVTTHYGNLKKYAEDARYVVNAAMRFDLEKLVPQYILEVGQPGSSFALEIAANIGLPGEILQRAKDKIGDDPVAFEILVGELEQEKQKFERYNRQSQELQKSLEEQRSKYEEQLSEIQGSKKQIVNEARVQAEQLLAEANQRIEATIRTIQESKAKKSVTHKARRQLNEFRKKTQPRKNVKKEEIQVLPGPVKKGDLVRIKESDAQGEVIKVSGNSAEILMGSLKSKVPLARLQKVGKVQAEDPKPGKTNMEIHKKRARYSTQLDVRGLRAAEALKAVADFIDEGILLGMTDLSILHGKGDGILRTVIRKELQGDPSIQSIKDEHVERGGAGITLIKLK